MVRRTVKWPLLAIVLLLTFLNLHADRHTLLGIDSAVAAEISYIYDDLGRLKAVVDPATDTAVYNYDAVGNLLSISRQSSSIVSIIEFTPKEGPIGTTVTIYGTGFSTTPSENAVTFNSVAAAVTSATATKMEATVPSGATTGTIGVTSPAGSDTSSEAFTVTATDGTPTITNFAPTIGTVGTSVTISGTNFEPTASKNNVRVNIGLAVVNSSTSTSIATTVPSGTGSGRISVTTRQGKAVSTADFFIPPSPYTAADVQHTGRMIAGGSSHTVAISTAGKIGLVVFDGTANQRISLQMTSVTFGWASVSIFKPDQTNLLTTGTGTGGQYIDTVTLPVTGTYTIFVDPQTTSTGNMTLTLYDVLQDFTATITPGGSPVTVNITTPGQNGKVTFSGTANQRVSLRMTNVTIGSSYVSILKPDQTNLVGQTWVGTGGNYIDTLTLPVTGTYTIFVNPLDYHIGNMTLTLYDVPQDFTATIVIDGESVTASTITPGQNIRLTFSAVAGQQLGLGMTGVVGGGMHVSVLKPDNSALVNPAWITGNNALDFQLPTTGTYTILANPPGANTGSMTFTLSEDIDAGSIVIDGASATVTISRAGQKARLTFSGTTGQQLGMGMTNLVSGGMDISVLKPDGTALVNPTWIGANKDLDFKLTADGVHTILANPPAAGTRSMTFTLSQDINAGAITVNGSSVPITITRVGQKAWLTFAGTTGQQVTVRLTGNTMGWLRVRLYRPNGTTQLTTSNSNASNFNLATQTLPEDGTYIVLVDPPPNTTGSVNVAATNP